MTFETVSTIRSHAGTQGVYTHASSATKTDMTFSVFVPDHEVGEKLPVIWYLSGLTCTQANVTEKGEFRAACAAQKVIFIAPDTSPRGDDVPDDADGSYDFGLGAGFYVNATQEPFAKNYQMQSYIEDELPKLIAENFPADMDNQAIMGHSMGGHGALTIGLRNPQTYKSVSAFSPIVAPASCPWGDKALTGYIGDNKQDWAQYDACLLLENGHKTAPILVDQGLGDNFLENQLMPEKLEAAAKSAGQSLTLRRHEGYDHSYYFISSFMADHIAWHAKAFG